MGNWLAKQELIILSLGEQCKTHHVFLNTRGTEILIKVNSIVLSWIKEVIFHSIQCTYVYNDSSTAEANRNCWVATVIFWYYMLHFKMIESVSKFYGAITLSSVKLYLTVTNEPLCDWLDGLLCSKDSSDFKSHFGYFEAQI